MITNDHTSKLVRVGWFKVCHVMQNQTLNIWREKTCVTFFVWYQKVTDAGHFLGLMTLHSCITLILISTTIIVLYCFVKILYNVCLYVYWVCEVTKWIENWEVSFKSKIIHKMRVFFIISRTLIEFPKSQKSFVYRMTSGKGNWE